MGVSENKVHPMYGHFNRKYDDKPSKLGLHNFQTNPYIYIPINREIHYPLGGKVNLPHPPRCHSASRVARQGVAQQESQL